jgi:hypothetical protein
MSRARIWTFRVCEISQTWPERGQKKEGWSLAEIRNRPDRNSFAFPATKKLWNTEWYETGTAIYFTSRTMTTQTIAAIVQAVNKGGQLKNSSPNLVEAEV